MKKGMLIYGTILFVLAIFTSCSMDLKDEKSVSNWIDGKSIFIEGKLVFHSDGTFNLKPQMPNDPTQNYTGTWVLGSFRTHSDGSGGMRDLTIKFSNSGFITDGGNQTVGYGKVVTGFISKSSDGYTFTSESKSTGLVYDHTLKEFGQSSKYWSRDFE